MKFEAEIDLNYRQLLALYQVSERLFRRWQMLLFRVVCLAVGVWRVWKTWGDIQADGLSFTRVSYLLIGVLFLSAALIPNIISAGCARMRVMYSGKLHFTDRDFYEVVGGRTIGTTMRRSLPWCISGDMTSSSWINWQASSSSWTRCQARTPRNCGAFWRRSAANPIITFDPSGDIEKENPYEQRTAEGV